MNVVTCLQRGMLSMKSLVTTTGDESISFMVWYTS